MFNITPYQFLEWKQDSFCCGDYVIMVLRDHFSLVLPPLKYSGEVQEASRILKGYPYRHLFKKIDQPKPYCVVELQQFKSPDHVGVCVEIDNQLVVTHCIRNSGVVISTFQEIQEDYKIVGFYEYCS